jgi:hypothetical protein
VEGGFRAESQRERRADCSSESDRHLQTDLRSRIRRDLFSDSQAELLGVLQDELRGLELNALVCLDGTRSESPAESVMSLVALARDMDKQTRQLILSVE